MIKKLSKVSRRVGGAYPDVFEGIELIKPKRGMPKSRLGMLKLRKK